MQGIGVIIAEDLKIVLEYAWDKATKEINLNLIENTIIEKELIMLKQSIEYDNFLGDETTIDGKKSWQCRG